MSDQHVTVHNHPPRRPISNSTRGAICGVALCTLAIAALALNAVVMAFILSGVGCVCVVLGVLL